MDNLMKVLYEHEIRKCEAVCKVLNAKGFKAQSFGNSDDAVKAVMEIVKDAKTIGIPGSVTIRQIGLIDKLLDAGKTVYQHWDPTLTPDKVNQRLINANGSDFFITGCNAVTMDGQLVNIDGKGNRISAMVWAPGKIIYIMGSNKITPDLETAIKRIKNEATPPNSVRVKTAAPCSLTGKCIDCNSPQRSCRVTSIMDYPPFGRECHVIMIAEKLGY